MRGAPPASSTRPVRSGANLNRIPGKPQQFEPMDMSLRIFTIFTVIIAAVTISCDAPRSRDRKVPMIIIAENSIPDFKALGFKRPLCARALAMAIASKIECPELEPMEMLGEVAKIVAMETDDGDVSILLKLLTEFCANRDSALEILRSLNWTCIRTDSDDLLESLKSGGPDLNVVGRSTSGVAKVGQLSLPTPPNCKSKYICISPPSSPGFQTTCYPQPACWIVVLE